MRHLADVLLYLALVILLEAHYVPGAVEERLSGKEIFLLGLSQGSFPSCVELTNHLIQFVLITLRHFCIFKQIFIKD